MSDYEFHEYVFALECARIDGDAVKAVSFILWVTGMVAHAAAVSWFFL